MLAAIAGLKLLHSIKKVVASVSHSNANLRSPGLHRRLASNVR